MAVDTLPRAPSRRWECHCSSPPVLLAMYEPGCYVQVKIRDRGFVVLSGTIVAQCPKCGACHTLRIGDGE